MVVAELLNTGSGWAELTGGDYTVYDTDDNVVGTGSFLYAYPKYLPPGGTGYLADNAVFEDSKAKSVKRVETEGTFDQVDPTDVIALKTSKVVIKREAYGDGLHTTGTVSNPSTQDVTQAHVGSFFLDAKGHAIGFAYTNLIENLTAGKTKGFATIDSWCPVKRTSVSKVVTFASDDNY